MADRQNPEKRTRASTACENCRARRTKCIVPPKHTACSGCIVNSIQCVFRHYDERKRPTSKAYVNSLLDRIALLEKTILELGHPLPASACGSQAPISFSDAGVSTTSPSHPPSANFSGEATRQALPIAVKSGFRKAYATYYNVVGFEDMDYAFQASSENRDEGAELLEICVLAMGSHLAESANNELLKEAKARLDMELQHHEHFSLVKACYILSDLDLALGDIESSWAYANKAIEILQGVIEKPTDTADEASYWELTRDLAVSCRLRDHFWTTFRNRPLDSGVIKDITSQSDQRISSLEGSRGPLGYHESVDNFHERFQELASLITDILNNFYPPTAGPLPVRSLLEFDRRLHSWYTKLPSAFKLSADKAFHSAKFFLLHQQYHAALILLHWPFARYHQNAPSLDDAGHEDALTLRRLSRACCSKNALRIAKIIQEQKQDTSIKLKHFTTLQYATIAAISLVAAIGVSNIQTDRQVLLENLQSVAESLRELAVTFELANALAATIQTVLQENEVSIAALLKYESSFKNHILMSPVSAEGIGRNVHTSCESLEEWAFTNVTHEDIVARSSSSAFDGDFFSNEFLHPIENLDTNAGALSHGVVPQPHVPGPPHTLQLGSLL